MQEDTSVPNKVNQIIISKHLLLVLRQEKEMEKKLTYAYFPTWFGCSKQKYEYSLSEDTEKIRGVVIVSVSIYLSNLLCVPLGVEASSL